MNQLIFVYIEMHKIWYSFGSLPVW